MPYSNESQRLFDRAQRNPVPYTSAGALLGVLATMVLVLRSARDAIEPMAQIGASLKGLGLIGGAVAGAGLAIAAAFATWANRRDSLARAAQVARDDRQDALLVKIMDRNDLNIQQLDAKLSTRLGTIQDSITSLTEEVREATGRRLRIPAPPAQSTHTLSRPALSAVKEG